MSDDVEIRWVSYTELAEARGIDRLSAIRIARDKKWRKQKGNDGTIRVAVPRNFLEAKQRRPSDTPSEIPKEITRKIIGLESRLELVTADCERAQTEVRELTERTAELREERAAAVARAELLQAEVKRLRTMVDRLTTVPGAVAWNRLRELWRSKLGR
jgi:predicted nuclease with TOPRIM domain